MEALLKQPAAAPGPSEELRAQLLIRTANWKMLPDIAVKALAMTRDPNCSIKDFSTLVESDTKLAMEILRITNSAFYASRTPILNLKQAVTRLGFAHCRNVILSASLGTAMRRFPLAEAWIQMVLWRHSVLTGGIAMALNRKFSLGFFGEEYTAGLVHDIGRSLLAVAAPMDFSAADPLDFVENSELLNRERDVVSTDHCELGAWFLEQSGIPDTLVSVVRSHHSPGLATEHRSLVALISTADHMANYLQRSGSADGYIPEENPAIEVLFEGNPNHAASLYKTAETIMKDSLREVNSANGPLGLT